MPRLWTYLLLAAILAAAVLCAMRSLNGKSPTYDEYSYYGLGKDILQTRSWEKPAATFHPPLSYYLHSLPLMVKQDRRPYGNLTLAREVLLVASLVPLIIGSFLWARQLYGPTAGLLASFLVAFDPSILAHARLITPDATLTCWWVVSLYLWWLYLRTGAWRWHAAASAALGLALLTKYTALVLALLWPLTGLVLGRRAWKRSVAGGMIALAGAGLVLVAGYLFEQAPCRIRDVTPRSRLLQTAARIRSVAGVPLPVPCPYVRGLDLQRSMAEEGWPAFLMGQHSKRGWWYYFLVALAVKTPLPLFALLLLRALTRHTRNDLFVLLTGLALLAYMSLSGRVNIGLRYILPLYPLLCVYASGCTRDPGSRRRVAAAVLVVWYAVASFRIFPDYLAYFNELIGGPRNGYRYLIDSNLDWGQDDDRALAFASNAARPVQVNPGCVPVTGLVLVSATRLQGVPGVTGFEAECYDWLRHLTPVGHVGYSYLLFEVPPPADPANSPEGEP